jgi:hypothetical protein
VKNVVDATDESRFETALEKDEPKEEDKREELEH